MSYNEVTLMYSGGPDSTTLLYDLINQGYRVHALTYNFGEMEGSKELLSSKRILNRAIFGNCVHHCFDFSNSLKKFYGLPQPQFMRKPFSPTIITESDNLQPFGSAIALMLTASWSLKQGINEVYYAVHKNDTIYHDNNRPYFELLSTVTSACEGDQYRVRFLTPYLDMDKSEVLLHGMKLGVPFGDTWSCALGEDVHCGICDPCRDRRMAFENLGVEDPVTYKTAFAESVLPNTVIS